MDLYKIITSDNILESINSNKEYLLKLIPEIKDMIGFEHKHPHHHLDVWNHTLLVLSKSANNFDIRLVLLLHDIGKPHSYQEEDGIRHFKNHPKVSARMSFNILKRLNYEESYINKICYYIENHDTKITDELLENNYDDALIIYEVQKCDALSHHPDKLKKRIEYLDMISDKINEKNMMKESKSYEKRIKVSNN